MLNDISPAARCGVSPVKSSFRVWYTFLAILACAQSARAGEADKKPGKVEFARDIRPILANHCWSCHGPDEKTRESGLRLDVRDAAIARLKSGNVALVPGDVKASGMMTRIHAKKESQRMPPPDSKKPLSDAQKQLLQRWIAEGAEYQEHWAFLAPKRPAVPTVKDRAWVRNPIDAFVLHRLEKEGMRPSPEAEPRTLIRRLSFDLTGLPPSLDEVDDFVKAWEASPANRQALVERAADWLLASPRYAERMTVPWLDAARYADTNGYNNDEERTMWPWRDWVIDAFRTNMPYDRFLVEQLAGDLLPNPTLSQRIATGFNRNHVLTTEGGIFEEEYRVEYVADRVHTTATAVLGLSMQCARCHDHKYDPITQKEYYQFFSFFNNVNEKPLQYNKAAAAEPFVRYQSAETQAKLAALTKQRADAAASLKRREADLDLALAAWEKSLTPTDRQKLAKAGAILHLPLDEVKGTQVTDALAPTRRGTIHGTPTWVEGKIGKALQFDGKTHVDLGSLVAFDSVDRFTVSAWIFPTSSDASTVISRMDDADAYRGWDLLLEGGKVASHLIHRWPDDGLKVVTKQPLSLNAWHHLSMSYDGSRKAAGVRIYVDGKPQPLDVSSDKLQGTIRTDKPLHLGKRGQSAPFKGKIDDVQLFASALTTDDAARLAQGQSVGAIGEILALAPARRDAAQQSALRRYYLDVVDPEARRHRSELADLDRQLAALDKAGVPVMVMAEMSPPRQAHLLKRGQYDQPGDKVQPGVPALLPPLPKDAPTNRLGLARWMVDPAHPLTARVAVNRWWSMYFAAGLVESVEDFGLQGELPSHPELLDWLATELIRTGWDVKAMQKLIVTSNTYRQSSRVTKDQFERDPKNRLLARAPRQRLSAETIRDNALAVSGLLKERLGGPSVKPYQPAGLWEDVSVERRYKYVADKGDGLYRRSMYTFWRRTCPPPSMLLFDAPDRETCFIRRARTNTPLHALLLLNEPIYVEAARKLAERVLHQAADADARLTLAFRLTLARTPTAREKTILGEMVQESLAKFRKDPEAAAKLLGVGDSPRDARFDAAELAAWTTAMNLLLNLDETITKG
jgi:hypothetical protein